MRIDVDAAATACARGSGPRLRPLMRRATVLGAVIVAVLSVFTWIEPAEAAPGSFSLTSATPSCVGTAGRITLIWTSSAGAKSYEVYRNNVQYASGVNQLSYINSANLVAGSTYSYFVRAKDSSGSRDSGIVSARAPSCAASSNQAPELSLVATPPSSVGIGQTYTISVRATDSNGNLSNVDLDWNDGSASEVDRQSASGQQGTAIFSRTFNTSRTINWSSTAYDSTGAASNQLRGTFEVVSQGSSQSGTTSFCTAVTQRSVCLTLLNPARHCPGTRAATLIFIHGLNFFGVPGDPQKGTWDQFVSYSGLGGCSTDVAQAFDAYEVSYYSNDTGLATIGDALGTLIDQRDDLDAQFAARPIVIVAHSQGGLIARYALDHSNRAAGVSRRIGDRVLRLITLGTPHHGSPLANGPAVLAKASGFSGALSRTLESFFNTWASDLGPHWYEPNRTDLFWDNYKNDYQDQGFLDYKRFPGERNGDLVRLNLSSTWDGKIIAYAGTTETDNVYDIFSTATLFGLYPEANDGFVPVDSALFYNKAGSSRVTPRVFQRHNHEEMHNGNGDGSLFASLRADLLTGLPTPTASSNPSSSVTTGSASSIGSTSAAVSGSVVASTSVTTFFDFGETSGYGGSVSAGTYNGSATLTNFSATLSGLRCGTTYQYRARAQSSGAGTQVGTNRSFVTTACSNQPPASPSSPSPAADTLVTGQAFNITAGRAILSAVATLAESSSVYFDYGTTLGYGSTANAGTFGPGSSLNIEYSIGGLSCGTTYQYRVRAQRSSGTTAFGSNQSFTTVACPTSGQPTDSLRLSVVAITGNGNQGLSATIPHSVSITSSSGVARSWSASVNASWVTLSASSGVTPSNLVVYVKPGGLSVGQHSAVVTITTPSDPGRLYSIPVDYGVVP